MIRIHQRINRLLSFLLLFATTLTLGYSAWLVEDKEAEISESLQTNDKRAVCYNKTTSVKYTTIEKALNVANSGDEIFVIPALKNSDGSIYEITIKSNCTVKEGVTLSLPYSEETYFNDKDHSQTKNAGFADSSEEKINEFRQTLVVIDAGVKLEIKGTLNIGGIIGSPNQGLSGQTSDKYCEIDLGRSAILQSNGGTINCYGYIKRVAENNGSSLVVTNNGVLLTPFIIYDFKGGSKTKEICKLVDEIKYCPFQIFDLCNIQVKTTIYSGSFWKAYASLYVDKLSLYVPATLNFISSESSNTALILESGSVNVDYSSLKHKTTIDINGESKFGSLNMTVAGMSIDTSKFFFPISYLFDFNINKNAILNVPNKVKLMNGSNLTINDGGTLNLTNSLIIYKDFTEINTGYIYRYGNYTDSTKATLTNNGVINVLNDGGIGGYIDTTSTTGVLNYLTENYEIKSPEDSDSFSDSSAPYHIQNAKGLLTTDKSTFVSDSNISCNYFTAVQNSSNTSVFGWNYSENAAVLKGIKSTGSDQTTTCGSNTLEADIYNESVSEVTYDWSLDLSSVADSDKDKITIVNNGKTATIQNVSVSDYTIPVTLKITDSLNIQREITDSFTVKAKLASDVPVDIDGVSFTVERKVDGEDEYTTLDLGKEEDAYIDKNKYSFYSGQTTNTTGTKMDLSDVKDVYYKLKINLLPEGGYFDNVQYSWYLPQQRVLSTNYRLNENDEFINYSAISKGGLVSEPNGSNSPDIEFLVRGNSTNATITACYLQAKLYISYTDSNGTQVEYKPTTNTYFELRFYLIKK